MAMIRFGGTAVEMDLVAYMQSSGDTVTLIFRKETLLGHLDLVGDDAKAAKEFIAARPVK